MLIRISKSLWLALSFLSVSIYRVVSSYGSKILRGKRSPGLAHVANPKRTDSLLDSHCFICTEGINQVVSRVPSPILGFE